MEKETKEKLEKIMAFYDMNGGNKIVAVGNLIGLMQSKNMYAWGFDSLVQYVGIDYAYEKLIQKLTRNGVYFCELDGDKMPLEDHFSLLLEDGIQPTDGVKLTSTTPVYSTEI